jgi:hypothetical protein
MAHPCADQLSPTGTESGTWLSRRKVAAGHSWLDRSGPAPRLGNGWGAILGIHGIPKNEQEENFQKAPSIIQESPEDHQPVLWKTCRVAGRSSEVHKRPNLKRLSGTGSCCSSRRICPSTLRADGKATMTTNILPNLASWEYNALKESVSCRRESCSRGSSRPRTKTPLLSW